MLKQLLFAACCITSIYAHAQGKNVYNLDFEQVDPVTHLPSGWGFGEIKNDSLPTDTNYTYYTLDTKNTQHGNYALCIDWSAQPHEWTCAAYIIDKKFKGNKIKLTGYLKTENVSSGYAGLWMRIDGESDMLQFNNMEDNGVKGTMGWKQYSIELPYDSKQAEKIWVGALITGKGKVWLDDLHITIDGKEISELKPVEAHAKKNEDTLFANGSGITAINITATNTKLLSNLGTIWGFIKYYHPAVADGDYDMDAELFHVLPKVIAAQDDKTAYKIIEEWVDHFGLPAHCKNCTDVAASPQVKLLPDYNHLFDKENLPGSLSAKLDNIRKNRYYGTSHYYIKTASGVGNPIFEHETPYKGNAYPDAGLRLLTVYRFWNMVQYFYPNRHLTGEDWNDVLPRMIPQFCNAADSGQYAIACLQLIGSIHDSHAGYWSYSPSLTAMKGKYVPPFRAKFIEDKLVVVGYYLDTLGVKNMLQPGDVIENINDKPIAELVTKYLPLTTGSNLTSQLRDMAAANGWLLRTNDTITHIHFTRDGKPQDAAIPCVQGSLLRQWYTARHNQPAYKILDGNIGYIYPASLTDQMAAHIKDTLETTKGIIIDMRCYPTSFMPFTYGAWLKQKASLFVTFTIPDLRTPGVFSFQQGPSIGGGRSTYKGKLIIIVNEETQSQAEYTTMALCTVPGCKVIGSTTAGADGNVSSIVLPGGVSTMFSGIGILYPDGTESQRTGVKIDKIVTPTIAGIKNGRDELLEEAVKMINE